MRRWSARSSQRRSRPTATGAPGARCTALEVQVEAEGGALGLTFFDRNQQHRRVAQHEQLRRRRVGLFTGKVESVQRPLAAAPTAESSRMHRQGATSEDRREPCRTCSRSTRRPPGVSTWHARRAVGLRPRPARPRARPAARARCASEHGPGRAATRRCGGSTAPTTGAADAAPRAAAVRRGVRAQVVLARRRQRRRARGRAAHRARRRPARRLRRAAAVHAHRRPARVGAEIAADLAAGPPDAPAAAGRGGLGQDVVALRAMLGSSTPAARRRCSRRPRCSPSSTTGRSRRCSATSPRAACSAAPTRAPGSRCSPARWARPRGARRCSTPPPGEAGIVIGTHALLEEQVQFADLGLVVVDEQHRFGVEQRAALPAKARHRRRTCW